MNKDIVGEFVHFYYKCLNDSKTELLVPHLKDNSHFIRHNIELHGTHNIVSQITQNCVKYSPVKIDIMINGDRRANILITGTIHNGNTSTHKFSEYLLFSFSNKKEYWLHSSILHLINE